MDKKNNPQRGHEDETDPSNLSHSKQEQSDPQLTELRGFTDSSEDLEPVLTDGTKAPDKEKKD
jgi:hypothetical protein